MTQYILPKPADDTRSVDQYTRVFNTMVEEIQGANSELFIDVRKCTRSLAQNSYLWGLVYPTVKRFMADNHNKDYSEEAIHEACKEMFLPSRVEQLATREVRVYRSTTKLTRQEFSDYLEHIFRWAGGFGCSIPQPDFQWKVEQAA